jgi:hypothetical protein
VKQGKSHGKARRQVRQARDFYTLGSDCLWITFVDNHLCWAFARPEVIWLGNGENGHGVRMRRTIGGWRKTDLKGNALRVSALSTKLTQVGAFRQTICRVKASDYLLRKIRGIDEPNVGRARQAQAAVVVIAQELISNLHWTDFETMTDLIFARTGWQRVTEVGGTQKDVDMILRQQATDELAFVQVKSRAGAKLLDDYVKRFYRSGVYQRMFFICHSPTGKMNAPDRSNLHVWTGERLAQVTVRAGLLDWLIEKSN